MVWSHLLAMALGIAIGACGCWFQVTAGEERRQQLSRDARLRVAGVRFATPARSNCRRLDDEAGP